MMKKLLITLGVLFVILVIAARVIPSFISEERIKAVVAEKTQDLLGYEINIRGKLSFRLFPIAGVYMEDVVIGTAPGKSQDLATFKSMKVDVETLALINGNVIIRSLLLNDPVIHLVVDKSGKQNWVPQKKEGDQIYRSDDKSESSSSQSVKSLSLEDVRISNGSVAFQDDRTKESWQAKNININITLDDMNSPFKVDGRLDYNKQTLSFNSTFTTLSSFLNKKRADVESSIKSELMNIEAKGKIDGGSYIGSTSLKSSSLTKAVEWLSQKPLGAKFASKLPLSLSSKTNCSPDACKFTDAELKLDSIEAAGSVNTYFDRSVPSVEVKLDTNVLDFNLFMAPPNQAADFSLISDANAAEGWSTDPMNFDVLRSINLVANINAAGIMVKNIHIGKTAFRAKIERGILSTDIIDAAFYNGKATIMASVDASGQVPVIQKQVDFRDIQMEPFLKDAEISDRFKGKGSLKFGIASSGNNQRDIVSNLKGTGSLLCKDGSIKGVNIAQMIRNVQSAFKDVNTAEQSTDFSEITGNFLIDKGIISNQDLMMKAPLLRASGKGMVNLPARTVNYRLTPEVVQTAQGQGGKEKTGLGVPVIVEGSLDNPSFRPDLASTIQEALKDPEKLKTTVKDVKEQLKENKGAIKGLLQQFKKP